jgi:hypothetical protein
MARVKLTTEATEKSTLVVSVSFYDETGSAAIPISASWRLTNCYGMVVNGRADVSIQSPTSTERIVLTGDDLLMLGEMDDGVRLLLVQAIYNSDAGVGLALNEEIEFVIRSLVGVQS